MAAIVLSLKYRKDITEVKVEGKTEDIELYFANKQPMYIQAKSVSGDPADTKKANGHCNHAFNTLVNSSNLTKGKYSNLMYITNMINPLNLKDDIKATYWLPHEDTIYIKNFNELPEEGKKFLQAREETGKKELENAGYISDDKYLSWSKVQIATLIFPRSESGREDCHALEEQVKDILDGSTLSIQRNVINLLKNRYHENAASFKTKIIKEDLCWIFIFKYLENTFTNLESIDIDAQDEVQDYVDNFLKEQETNIDAVNMVLATYYKFKQTSEFQYAKKSQKSTNDIIDLYVNNCFDELKELFTLSEEEKIQRAGIKILITKILKKMNTIKKLKGEFNLNDNNKSKN